jgi:hypothetical protein
MKMGMCLFNDSMKCQNTDRGFKKNYTDAGVPYCRMCDNVPEFDKVNFGDASNPLSYELALQVAIATHRQRKEEHINKGFKKFPAWLMNLKDEFDYFKVPCQDHSFIMKLGDEYVFVTEPYDIGLDDLKELYEYCDSNGLNCDISGRSSHLPGSCIRIEFTEKKRPKLSYEEYTELGKYFKIFCNTSNHLQVRMSNIFGCKHVKLLDTINKRVGEVRTTLDDDVCGNFHEKGDKEVVSVFYGGECVEYKQLDDIPGDLKHRQFTLEQYQEVGNELKKLHELLNKLTNDVQRYYGKALAKDMIEGNVILFRRLTENLEFVAIEDLIKAGYSYEELPKIFID